jgi:DNA (cytosine-5)-methyltransferase 1
MQTVQFVEKEDYCQQVLKKNFPGIPIHGDITTFNGKQYENTIKLICGGFPCQPYSQAGERKGKEDDRHLWPEYFRVIQEVRPHWVIGENVTGIINMELDNILSDLESQDYSCQTLIIPACSVNAPHRRDRVWIIGNLAHSHKERIQGGEKTGNIGKQGKECNQFPVRCSQRRIGENWSVEPQLGRVANGIPRRVDRLKALGNAVVPQIVEILGNNIMEIERSIDYE